MRSSSSDYASPPGPPPPKRNDDFVPLSPPPSHNLALPPDPPPAQDKKQHDWETAVPDTSLLPPPPAFFSGFERSPVLNATEEQAEVGERWCRNNPLHAPATLGQTALQAMEKRNINLFAPPSYKPRGSLKWVSCGKWKGRASKGTQDTCISSYPPLYSVSAHSPLATGRLKRIYYEVKLVSSGKDSAIALGFNAPPYPAFRLPGWHRGSLGVHSDDGRRYTNDRWGGKTFTKPFKKGDVLGLGMDLWAAEGGGISVKVFFTRNGKEDGSWDLHEETDKDTDLPVTGLEGFHDLCAAVGVYEQFEFEIVFAPGEWKWRDYHL